ncbi:MAG TPA: lysylphosphatidylglycerol synthase transmembrane domain-containing protein, partial [Acidimicrobiales bacterium]|nr:lysylphosphatidylglycerol synthase transmembrane domain-containing protein [Acidimicrobiales bacterium]
MRPANLLGVTGDRLHLVGDDPATPRPSRWRLAGRAALLAVGAAALYGLAPRILDVWEEAPRIETIGWFGLAAMVGLEALSFAAVWRLQRIIVPELDAFSAATSQLTSNAVSRAVPGGAAFGAGVNIRMWVVAGVAPARAAAGMATVSLISTGTLLALPIVSFLVATIYAPVPQNLAVVAVGGAVLSAALFAFAGMFLAHLPFASWIAGLVHAVGERLGRLLGRPGPSVVDMLEHREELLRTLGRRWHVALAASVANWGLDYLVLVAALVFLGANPRFSVVLLAYGAAAVLAMIPITPGGVGFVEAGLTSLLVVAGVPAADALLATLAYRIASYWLPLPAGLVAWLAFRRRYERTRTSSA